MMPALLDLSTIEIQPELLNKLPPGLRQYYQALPLAQEGDSVSVAMVYPQNTVALSVLQDLLEARVVPVACTSEAMQAAIARLELNEPDGDLRVLVRSAGVAPGALLMRLIAAIPSGQRTPVTYLDSPQIGDKAVLAAAGEGKFHLVALPLSPVAKWANLALRATTSVLLASSSTAPVRHALLVLRGFAADHRAVQWAARMASREQASLTLLPLTDPDRHDLRQLLAGETAVGRHLHQCMERVREAGVVATLRVRQGTAVEQVTEEVAARAYELLVISAEGRGEFVAAVLAGLRAQPTSLEAVLIVKPDRAGALARLPQSGKRRLHRGTSD